MADNNCNAPQDLFCKFKNTIDILNSSYLKACCVGGVRPGTATCQYVAASSFAPGNTGVVPLFPNICNGERSSLQNRCVECLMDDIFNIYASICANPEIGEVSKTIREKIVKNVAKRIWAAIINSLTREEFLAYLEFCAGIKPSLFTIVRWEEIRRNHADLDQRPRNVRDTVYGWVEGYLNDPSSQQLCNIITGVLRYGRVGQYFIDDCSGEGGCITSFMGSWVGCDLERTYESITQEERTAIEEAQVQLCSFSAPEILLIRWQDEDKYRKEDPPPYLDMIAEGAIAVPVDSTVDCYGSYRVVLSPNTEDTEIFLLKWNTIKEGITTLSRLSDRVLEHTKKIIAKKATIVTNYIDLAERNRKKYILKLTKAMSGTSDRLYKILDKLLLYGVDQFAQSFPCDGAGFGGILNRNAETLVGTDECWKKLLKEPLAIPEAKDRPTGVEYSYYPSETDAETLCIPKADFDNIISNLRQVKKDVGNQCESLITNHIEGFTYTENAEGLICLPYDPTTKNLIIFYKYTPSKAWVGTEQSTDQTCVASIKWETMQAIVNLLNESKMPCGGSPFHSIVQALDAEVNTAADGRGAIGGSHIGTNSQICDLKYSWPNEYYLQPVDPNGAIGGAKGGGKRNELNIGTVPWVLPNSCGIYPYDASSLELIRLVLSMILFTETVRALSSTIDVADTFDILRKFVQQRQNALDKLEIPDKCLQPIAIKGRGKGPDARVIALPAEDILWKEEPSVPAPNSSPLIWWTDAPDGDIDIP